MKKNKNEPLRVGISGLEGLLEMEGVEGMGVGWLVGCCGSAAR